MISIDMNWVDSHPTENKTNKKPSPDGKESDYEIRIKGHLDSKWSEWLEGMEVSLFDNGEMILRGEFVDQTALMGVLNKISRINLTILSVNIIQKKEEEKMNTIQNQNRKLEAFGWGAIFIWWGMTEMLAFLPDGSGAIGIGLILLGLNAARYLSGIAASNFTTTLGILAIVWGGLEMAETVLSLPFELPAFAVLLIVLGVIVIGGELLVRKNHKVEA
jgi:hypothetical protein